MAEIEFVEHVNLSIPGIELPREFLDTTHNTLNEPDVFVREGENLQNILDNAEAGSTIFLEAGKTFTGNYILPADGMLTIVSSRHAELPNNGKRVKPEHAPLMPKLVTENPNPVFSINDRMYGCGFVGLEITTTWDKTSPGITRLVAVGETAQTVSEIPEYIRFDRAYIHGLPTTSIRRAISLQARNAVVENSYISEIHDVTFDSQAIACWKTPGPIKIVNNFLEASSENVGFGGAGTREDMIPADIEIRNNHFFKPLYWQDSTPRWVCKNLLEFKWGRRILVEGNLFENNWVAHQQGYGIVLTVRSEAGKFDFTVIRDLTFRNNVIKNSHSGFNITAFDGKFLTNQTENLAFVNNLFEDIKGTTFLLQGSEHGGLKNILVKNNTVPTANAQFVFNNGLPSEDVKILSNIMDSKNYCIIGTGTNHVTTYEKYLKNYELRNNVFFNAQSWLTMPNQENFKVPSYKDVGFYDYDTGDFALGPSSRFKDMGANVVEVEKIADKARRGACDMPNFKNMSGVKGIRVDKRIIFLDRGDFKIVEDDGNWLPV